MSLYRPLADHLAARKGDHWEASFEEIERTLGRPLPRSAYRYNAWWANQTGPGHSQTQGWRSVGWRTSRLDLERRRVRFERDSQPIDVKQPASEATESDYETLDQLLARAMAITGIEDRNEVIVAALREYIDQEAIRAVIELGGTMPDFEAAPRERPWG